MFHRSTIAAAACILITLGCAWTVVGAAPREDVGDNKVSAARRQLIEQYAGQLAKLSTEAAAANEPKLAQRLSTWLPKRDPYQTIVFKLPESLEPPAGLFSTPAGNSAGRDSSPVGSVLWDRWTTLRTAQADQLMALANQAHAARDYTLAYDLVREACRENPDLAAARAILGYLRYDDRWVPPEAARRLAAGQVLSEKFGWLPADQLKRYERGMRYWRGQWLSTEEDERQHASIKTGWRIDSEHFAVTTNHSLEEGVRLSRRLEKLYDVWAQVFVTYRLPETEMSRWFAKRPESKIASENSTAVKGIAAGSSNTGKAGGAPAVIRRPYNVIFFRNRDEYNAVLKPAQPQIDITLGIYFANSRTAYFFAGDEQYEGTLYHEATHQLFQESRQSAKDAGAKSNFWAVEAIACYMESLVEHDDYYTVGGTDEGRIPAARKRLLDDQFYVPLRELTPLGMAGLQRDTRLPKIYSQIAGQAWFFMHADAGRYRQAWIDYLLAIYGNRADANTLSKLTGRKYDDLDRAYYEFMRLVANGDATKKD